jgi:hypothetical protein
MTVADQAADDRTSPARRLAKLLTAAILGLVVLGGLWIIATALIARHDGNAAHRDLNQLRLDLVRGDETAATSLAHRIQHEAGATHARTTGPAWWVATRLPGLRGPADSIRSTAGLVQQLTTAALPPALKAGEILDPQIVREGPDAINLARLGESADPLQQAARAAGVIVGRERAVSASTWLGPANNARNSLISIVDQLQHGMSSLSTAARLLPVPLGASGPQRYFLGIETDAQSRGLGGLPGAYAILQASHGALTILRFGSDNDMAHAVAHAHLGGEFQSTYGDIWNASGYFGNSDPSPNFPDAAKIWMSMWQDKFHQHLNGALAVDPRALSYLLGAVGSVTLPDGTVLTGSNTVPFFESTVYGKFPYDPDARKQYQVDAARLVTNRILHIQSGALFRAASALQRGADEGRLLAYSSDPTVESKLAIEPVGGVLPRTNRPFLEVAIGNGGGNKLDYYLHRTITYSRASCAAGPATVTVVLHNSAPTSGLAPEVLGDPFHAPRHPGNNLVGVSLYSTAHSEVNDSRLDGKIDFIDTGGDQGHPDTEADVLLRPGQTRTLVFYVHEPAATGPLIDRIQPVVNPTTPRIIAPPACR